MLSGREGCPPLAPEMALASTVFANSVASSAYVRQKTLREVREADILAVREIKRAYELEPRREDYFDKLLEALKNLANAELHLESHAGVAAVAEEYVKLQPNDVATRLESAEFLVRAMVLAQGDSRLDNDGKAKLTEQYAKDALEDLREVGRISSVARRELTLEKELDLQQPWWRRALERPDFKAVMKEVNEQAKRVVD